MGRSRCGIALLIAVGLAAPSEAHAKRKGDGPTQIVPPKRKKRTKPAKDADLSEGGQRRGAMELTLGAVTAGVAAILIGRGAWELVEARRLSRECFDSDELACQRDNPPLHPRIAAGLSFGFAVPIAVASGFLFARGVRIHRDYKAFRRANPELSLRPWTTGHGGGLAVGGRF